MTTAEFFDMGGYAGYVWSAYAAAALVLGGLIAVTLRRNAQTRAELVRIETRAERRRREEAARAADRRE